MDTERSVEKSTGVRLDEPADFPGGFTILMAVYARDDARLLELAVRSILRNTLAPQEIRLVADGPLTEELDRAIDRLTAQSRTPLVVQRLPRNQGLALALNAALPGIRTPWVVRADADDVNLSHRFQTLATMVVRDPSLQLVGSAVLEVDPAGKPIAIRQPPEKLAEIRDFARRRSPFNHPSVAFLRDVVVAAGGYPPIHLKEDYALWSMLLQQGVRAANTREVLVHMSAGEALFKRRGGWHYARAEWAMQALLVRLGVKSTGFALVECVLRTSIALAPASLRGLLYRRMLRRPYGG